MKAETADAGSSPVERGVSRPVGYWVEYRPGDPCLYTVEEFGRETYSGGGEIRGLYLRPQPGCKQEPAAYRGRYWHQAKHFKHNAGLDAGAVPLYFGPVLHDPERDGDLRGVAGPLPERGWD